MRMLTTKLFGLALLALVAGCGDPAETDPEECTTAPDCTGETQTECATVSDCTALVPECRAAAACEAGQCVFENEPDGTALAEQTVGDCAMVVCDGAGATRIEGLATDIEDDGNPCTVDTCVGTTPTHTVQESLPCYSGPAGTLGKGICIGGVQQCDVSGNLAGGCAGEVLPQAEDCDGDGTDEDCDGQVNESGPSCTCGDGQISNAEGCDDGGQSATCDADCTPAVCGDGIVNVAAGETCDDENTSSADPCSSTCQPQEVLVVAAGTYDTCALLSGGKVKCWGLNDDGQLGLGDKLNRGSQPNDMGAALPEVDLGPGATATAIAIGNNHTCALLSSGQVKCWGSNWSGQLGLGDKLSRGDEPNEMGAALLAVDLGPGATATAIAAGGYHTCALLAGGTVKCWGYNGYGQLGLGDKLSRGDEPNEIGAALLAVDLGPGATATAIAAGGYHTCALLAGGSVKCWGENDDGQLGLANTSDRGDQPDEMGAALPTVDLGPGVTTTAIVLGNDSTCALLTSGSVKCWGSNYFGELGLGDTLDRGDQPGEMGAALPTVDLGPGATATSIDTDGSHVCAMLSNGPVKCWGDNHDGELGLGDDFGRGDEPGEMGAALPAVDLGMSSNASAVAAGGYHTCVIVGLRVKCWGHGAHGLGDPLDHGNEPGEMGDALPFVRLFNDQW